LRGDLGRGGSRRPGEATDTRLPFAGWAAFARLGTDDRGFDDHIVRAADHNEVFDIIAAHDHELPLPVHLKGIDDAEPLLPASPARQFDATAENNAEENKDKRHADQKAHRRQNEGECAILSKSTQELHVLGSLTSAANASN
jgi:hypothetical protein